MAQDISASHALKNLLALRQQARACHGSRPDPVPEDRDDRELAAWTAADRQLLEALAEQGWIDQAPDVFQVSSLDRSYSMARAGGRGWIAIASNALGETGWPSTPANDETAMLWRAHLLIHEAGHLRMHRWGVHFKPTPGRLPDEISQILDRWQLGPLSMGLLMPARTVMHECFADAFSIAALLEMTGHSETVLGIAKQLITQRAKDSRRSEVKFAQPGVRRASPTLIPFGGTHHTQHALEHMLQTRQAWRGQRPEVILSMLQQVASDAMLDWIAPDRILPGGRRQGSNAMESLVSRMELDLTQAAVERLGCLLMGHMDDWERREHPLKMAVDAAWSAITRELENHTPKARRAMRLFFEGPQGRTAEGFATVAHVRNACNAAMRTKDLALELRPILILLASEMTLLRGAWLKKPETEPLAERAPPSGRPTPNRATKPGIAP